MPIPTVEELLERNRKVTQTHEPLPYFNEFKEYGFDVPNTIVITCLDPRCIPENYFNLKYGEMIVTRTLGGRARHALKDIMTLDCFVSIKGIIIVHHTDCGATRFRDAAVKNVLKERVPDRAEEIDGMDFGEICDGLENSVRDDIKFLKSSPYIRSELKEKCHGFIFDVKSGKVNRVEEEGQNIVDGGF